MALFLLLGLTVTAAAASAALSPRDARQAPASMDPALAKLFDDWVAAWNSYDLGEVDRLFLADSRVTYFSSEREGLLRGIEELRRHHEGFGFVSGGKVQPNRLWLEDLHAERFGDTAVVGGIWFFKRGAEPGARVQRGPVTFVAVRTETGWRLAHLHFANYPER